MTPPSNPTNPATANKAINCEMVDCIPKPPKLKISITVKENTIQKTSVNADSRASNENTLSLILTCFSIGITNDEETPPKANPVNKANKKLNPSNQNPSKDNNPAITKEDIIKLKMVKTKLCENSRTNELKLMLNAPSNNKKTKVKVVKMGAIPIKLPGVTKFKTKGPITKPRTIKNNTSGMLNFLKIQPAKKPKNSIKLPDNKVKVTTSMYTIKYYAFIYITENINWKVSFAKGGTFFGTKNNRAVQADFLFTN